MVEINAQSAIRFKQASPLNLSRLRMTSLTKVFASGFERARTQIASTRRKNRCH